MESIFCWIHIHEDHAADVERIQEKFPDVNIFVGDLSADPLCQWQKINCGRIYRVRSGETYEFDDLKIEIFAGRHTESSQGYYRASPKFQNQEGSLNLSDWFGNLKMVNAMETKIVIPHHYDLTEEYIDALRDAVREKSPETDLIMPEHQQWCRFGFGIEEI